jgi:hypothetical protein
MRLWGVHAHLLDDPGTLPNSLLLPGGVAIFACGQEAPSGVQALTDDA